LPAYRPLLLDQAGAAALSRLASERVADAAQERSPRQQKARGPSLLGRAKRIVLPLGMLAFGGLVTAGMAFGAVISASDGDGLTRTDALRIAVIALLSLMFLGQLLAMLRMLPGAGWVAARFARPPPPPPPQPLLDQVTATVLTRIAPEDLGVLSRAGRLRSRGRRLADLGSWVALVAVALGAMLFIAAGSVLGAWSAFWQGGYGIGSLIQIAFLLLAGFGVLMVSKLGLGGLGQRRLRRRRRLLKRMLRYLLRLFDSGRRWAGEAVGVAGSGAATGYMRHPTSAFERLSHLSPLQFGRALVLTAVVAGLAFYPLFAHDGTAGASGGASGLQLSTSGAGGPAGAGPQVQPATPVPPSPTPSSDDDLAGEQATGEADDEDDDNGGGAGGPGDLTDPSGTDDPTPSPTFTPVPPTATLTPIPLTATFTPIPCAVSFSNGELDFGESESSLGLTLELNDCGEALPYSLTSSKPSWIEVNPAGGTLQPGGAANITVLIDRDSLSPGTYTEEVEIATSIGTFDIPLFVEVEPPPCEVEVSTNSLNFGQVSSPETLEFEISLNDCGEDVAFDLRVAYPSRGATGWIFIDPSRGVLTPGSSVDIEVSVDPGPMAPGPNSADLIIQTEAGNFNVAVTACWAVPGGPPCGR
jgi:MFS family permease